MWRAGGTSDACGAVLKGNGPQAGAGARERQPASEKATRNMGVRRTARKRAPRGGNPGPDRREGEMTPDTMREWFPDAANWGEPGPDAFNAEHIAELYAHADVRCYMRDQDRRLARPGVPRAARHALRVARDVVRFGGSLRESSRQFAFSLYAADAETRQLALSVAASQGGKSNPLVKVADVRRHWDAVPVAESPRPARRAPARKERLPVEVARGVPLTRLFGRLGFDVHQRGRTVAIRCPFHDDAHPSLTVSPDDRLWFCWPCHVGGDGIKFVQLWRRMEFADAVREIAQWAA